MSDDYRKYSKYDLEGIRKELIEEFLEDWNFEIFSANSIISKDNHGWSLERYQKEMKEKWEKRLKE